MLKEYYNNETEEMRKVYNKYLFIWINITIPERNQEATLYLQELTSALLIQMLVQVHLTGNTSHDYQGFLRFFSICRFPLTIFYPLLCIVGHWKNIYKSYHENIMFFREKNHKLFFKNHNNYDFFSSYFSVGKKIIIIKIIFKKHILSFLD